MSVLRKEENLRWEGFVKQVISRKSEELTDDDMILRKFSATDNLLCRACTDNAVKDIASLSSAGS